MNYKEDLRIKSYRVDERPDLLYAKQATANLGKFRISNIYEDNFNLKEFIELVHQTRVNSFYRDLIRLGWKPE